ncbi:zinc finger protein 316-like [Zootermopsis nevadensis]|uniref:Gastrula zinc finger protein XlCGF46.1 n=1 Tax=Zootermopsis nevadensis TaxID=136037 RepID=A0A067RWK5_ZOONE|nr:zinc finger protein 316-like [Zootermopsis nevadensis]XP_021915256.1 zinc finger protein 316-like [Zootermopsis nevadensis]KDR24289.1 Gastrula zinc finger protein XlCGF46.1 [Zootermopsis nevadensis]
MNFSPFGGHFPASIPTIHQFAAKFTHDGTGGGLPPQSVGDGGGAGARYHTSPGPAHFNQHHPPIGMPVNMGKYNRGDGGNNPPGGGGQPQVNMMNPNSSKYHPGTNLTGTHHYSGNVGIPYSQAGAVQQQQQQSRPTSSPSIQDGQQQGNKRGAYHVGEIQPQDLCAAMMRENAAVAAAAAAAAAEKEKDMKREEAGGEKDDVGRPGSNEAEYSGSMALHHHHHHQHHHATQTTATMPSTWHSLATPGSTVADYLSQLPASTLPISLHHFLKYSAENIKKESDMAANAGGVSAIGVASTTTPGVVGGAPGVPGGAKKKKKKKASKEKKPRPKPGEIRLTTALDGSTLYCCPECHMAYPEKELLEQHLLGHTLERRFVCDICGAGLKRKDHLTRHKQSHNPERPYVCTVCLKAFKRKEQLTLHFVIHSGEKRHVCTECGKGFYRKDHLRKHTRSHIARRVKAELSQHAPQPQHPPTPQHQVATVSAEQPPPPPLLS